MSNLSFLILLVLAIINIIAFIIVGLDKRSSIKGDSNRYPEVSFFLMATIFGSLGIFLGLFVFRHKTQKIYFPLGIGFILVQQLALLILIYNQFLVK